MESLHLCCLQFLTSESYNFPYRFFCLLRDKRRFSLFLDVLILFVAKVNGIDAFISLSDFSLLVYRNTSDLCVLILYSATLLNSLISSNNFLILSFSSVQFSGSVVSNSLRTHESQHARPPCPSPSPGVHSDSHPSSQ